MSTTSEVQALISHDEVQALISQDQEFIPGDPEAEPFYGAILGRIRRLMPLLSVAGVAASWYFLGWVMAAGFALGCVVAYVNFQWLAHVVNALGERVVYTGRGESGVAIVGRFLLRYAFIAFCAYVISRFSVYSLYAMMAGLFVPTAAILCEAVYELSGGLSHCS